ADRFGPPPPEVEQLLDIVRIRGAARNLGIERIEAGSGRALLTFAPSTRVGPATLVGLVQKSRGRLAMKREFTPEALITRGGGPGGGAALRARLSELGRGGGRRWWPGCWPSRRAAAPCPCRDGPPPPARRRASPGPRSRPRPRRPPHPPPW